MDRPNPRAYLGLVVLLSQGRGFCAACWWLRCATRVARSYCLSSTLRTLPMRRSNTTPTEDHSDTVRHVSLLLPRDAMLARYMLPLCVRLSVSPSVSPSVTSRYCIETTGRIELVFGMEASLDQIYSTLCCDEIQVPTKITALSSRTFSLTPDLENFAAAYRWSKRAINLARERWTLRA